MNSYLRTSSLGLVAGILALFTWVAVIYLALAVNAFVFTLVNELARSRTAGIVLEGQIWALLGQSLVASGWNALRGLAVLWRAFVVSGILGIFVAWGYEVGRLLDPRRAWRISFLSGAALIVIAAVTWLFVQREQIALWMAESPEVYRWRDVLLNSQAAALTVAPIFALTIAYPAWAAWRWWFTQLGGARTRPNGAVIAPAGSPDDDHRTYATRLATLKRGAPTDLTTSVTNGLLGADERRRVIHNGRLLGLLALLSVCCFAGYLLAIRYHEQVALRLQHGETFVDATTLPHVEFSLRVDPDVQRLRIVNINGLGVVTISIHPAEDPTDVVGEASDWAFEWRADEYLYQDIPVQGLTPGDYILSFDQSEGWGYFEYVLSQGGGRSSHALATAAGLLLATALILASASIALTIARLSTDSSVGPNYE